MSSTAKEQEQDLWVASRRYVRGEISIDELKMVKLLESENLKNAIYLLAKHYTGQPFLDFFRWLKLRVTVWLSSITCKLNLSSF